jgi:hypothetical protein
MRHPRSFRALGDVREKAPVTSPDDGGLPPRGGTGRAGTPLVGPLQSEVGGSIGLAILGTVAWSAVATSVRSYTASGRCLISVAEYESMQETLDILSDDEALADLRQSREDFAAGDTFGAAQVRAELDRRQRGSS